MNLYILRHGLAVDCNPARLLKDHERPLTSKGRHQVRQTALVMRELKLRFDLILCSPLVRARETAEIIAAAMKSKTRPSQSKELQPAGDISELLATLSVRKNTLKTVLLVGHEPDLSHLISLLVTGRTDGGFKLKKSGLAKLTIENLRTGQCATLDWLLSPKLLGLMNGN